MGIVGFLWFFSMSYRMWKAPQAAKAAGTPAALAIRSVLELRLDLVRGPNAGLTRLRHFVGACGGRFVIADGSRVRVVDERRIGFGGRIKMITSGKCTAGGGNEGGCENNLFHHKLQG